MRVFHYGERLRFAAKLRAPRNFRNPGAFDYRRYLADRGIVMLASTKSTRVEVLPGLVGTRLQWWREQVHRSIVRKIHALWSADDAALIDAAVVGESAFPTPALAWKRRPLLLGGLAALAVTGLWVSAAVPQPHIRRASLN